MTAPTLDPPAGLPRDEAAGVFVALVLPFGEPVHPAHEHGGRTFGIGDVREPPRLAPVNVSHRHREVVGHIVLASETAAGWWASLQLDERGQQLVRDGWTAVSAEVGIDNRRLVAVALVEPAGTPGFASAGIVPVAPPVGRIVVGAEGWLTAVVREADVQGGRVIVNVGGIRQSRPAPPLRVAVDLNRARADAYAFSPGAFLDDMERDRQRYADRLESFRQAEADAVEAERWENAAVLPASALTAEAALSIDRWAELATAQQFAGPDPAVMETLARAAEERAAMLPAPPAAPTEQRRRSWLSRLRRALTFR